MCGFLVTVSKKDAINESIHRESLSLINHRGPDSTNVINDKRFWLGFNRLSILDLDERSSQPFFNSMRDIFCFLMVRYTTIEN